MYVYWGYAWLLVYIRKYITVVLRLCLLFSVFHSSCVQSVHTYTYVSVQHTVYHYSNMYFLGMIKNEFWFVVVTVLSIATFSFLALSLWTLKRKTRAVGRNIIALRLCLREELYLGWAMKGHCVCVWHWKTFCNCIYEVVLFEVSLIVGGVLCQSI